MSDLLPFKVRRPRLDALQAVPGLARIAAGAGANAAGWGVRAGLHTTGRVVRALRDPAETAELVREATAALGVVGELARSVATGVPLSRALSTAGESLGEVLDQPVGETGPSLRERGAALLERSRDVVEPETGHPAYSHVLDELAPDEARILLLLLGGPQPAVDVRTGGPMVARAGQLVAAGLTLIGMRAGVRNIDAVPAYLTNLDRLGLIWNTMDPVPDQSDYQVLEAQPEVLGALHSVKFARVVRRSIVLTPFGLDFVHAALTPPPDSPDAD